MKKLVYVIQITKTSIPLILGCLFLIVLIFTPSTTKAESYDVTARVDAPLPTSPGIITSPTDQQQLTSTPITVVGTCGDATYIAIFRNQVYAGTAACSGGFFSVQIDLALGANQLQVKVYNSTDNEGPQGPAITVYHSLPASPSSPLTILEVPLKRSQEPSITPVPSLPSPLMTLYSPYNYRTYKVGELWQGELHISGGSSPYTITVDWGDGAHSTQQSDALIISLSHTFSTPGTYHPIVRVTDSKENQASLQLLIPVVADEAKPATTSSHTSLLTTILLVIIGIILLAIIVTELGLAIRSVFDKESSKK